MTVILEVYTERGTTRRCDGVCHHASGERCHCICGGRFHGIGQDGVERLVSEGYDEIAAARERLALANGEFVQLRIGA